MKSGRFNLAYCGSDRFNLIWRRQNDFTLKNINPVVGCIQNRSIQEKQGRLVWVSKRGLERLDGGIVTLISDPVKNYMDNLISGYDVTTSRQLLDQYYSDFNLGFST